jgi:hypothetical protein
MDAKTINSGMIPTFKTLSSAPGRVSSGADEFSEAAPASSFVISSAIKVIVAIRPNPATKDVAVVTVLAVVMVTVVTVEIMIYPPFIQDIVHRDSFGTGKQGNLNVIILYLTSLVIIHSTITFNTTT